MYFCILFCFALKAQQTLTLKQAIEMGIANNLDVNQSNLQMQREDIAHRAIEIKYAAQP